MKPPTKDVGMFDGWIGGWRGCGLTGDEVCWCNAAIGLDPVQHAV